MKLAGNLALSLPLKLCLNSADEEFVGVPTTTALLEIPVVGNFCHPEGVPQGCLKDLSHQTSSPLHLNRWFNFGGAV
jgi:hypothetical protein